MPGPCLIEHLRTFVMRSVLFSIASDRCGVWAMNVGAAPCRPVGVPVDRDDSRSARVSAGLARDGARLRRSRRPQVPRAEGGARRRRVQPLPTDVRERVHARARPRARERAQRRKRRRVPPASAPDVRRVVRGVRRPVLGAARAESRRPALAARARPAGGAAWRR